MSNTTCRSHGIAQRALALFTAIALATALTPSFALAEEADGANAAAEQSASSDTANESKVVAESDSASKADASTSANKKDGASDATADAAGKDSASSSASDAADSSASKPAGKTALAPAAANGNTPAEQADETKTETVSATLVIKTHIGAPISKSFAIEKGKTVEDLLNLAIEQGIITDYTHGDPCTGYTSYYINSIKIGSTEYAPTSDTGYYWASTINGGWDTTGINETVITENGFSYELDYTTWMTPEATQYPVDKDAAHPDKASGNDTTTVIGSNGNVSTVTSGPTSSSNATLSWKRVSDPLIAPTSPKSSP